MDLVVLVFKQCIIGWQKLKVYKESRDEMVVVVKIQLLFIGGVMELQCRVKVIYSSIGSVMVLQIIMIVCFCDLLQCSIRVVILYNSVFNGDLFYIWGWWCVFLFDIYFISKVIVFWWKVCQLYCFWYQLVVLFIILVRVQIVCCILVFFRVGCIRNIRLVLLSLWVIGRG